MRRLAFSLNKKDAGPFQQVAPRKKKTLPEIGQGFALSLGSDLEVQLS